VSSQQSMKVSGEVCTCAAIALGFVLVSTGSLTPGVFISILNTFDRIGGSVAHFAHELVECQCALPSFQRVCEMLNKPVAILDEVAVQKRQLEQAKALERQALAAKQGLATGSGGAWRRLQSQVWVLNTQTWIQITDLSYLYSGVAYSSVRATKGLNAAMPLGGIVGLRSEADGMGVFTLMKLCTGHLHPTGGSVHVPPHVRTLLVHHEPLIIDSTLWDNLTFGRPDAPADFVWDVTRRLRLSEGLIEAQRDLRLGAGGCKLRLADRQVVCLARALISRSECLFLYKPTDNLSGEHRQAVLDTLADWVAFLGIFQREKEAHTVQLATGNVLDLAARTCYISLGADLPVPEQCTAVVVLSSAEAGGTRTLVNRRAADGSWSLDRSWQGLARVIAQTLTSTARLRDLNKRSAPATHGAEPHRARARPVRALSMRLPRTKLMLSPSSRASQRSTSLRHSEWDRQEQSKRISSVGIRAITARPSSRL